MQRKTAGQIEYYQFEPFLNEKDIIHGSFLRHGGMSEHPFESLNVSENGEDSTVAVESNLALISSVLDIRNVARLNQQHGKVCRAVHEPGIYDGDCIMTQESGLMLMVRHADCQAALFFDPVNRAIAAVHAGFRGLVQNIYQESLTAMNAAFGTDPKDVLVGIAPSLGPKKAEFTNFKEEFPEQYHKYGDASCLFDLWMLGKDQLVEAGIPPNNIELIEVCTFEARMDCYSYRRDKVTGRHATCIALKRPE